MPRAKSCSATGQNCYVEHSVPGQFESSLSFPSRPNNLALHGAKNVFDKHGYERLVLHD
jgi:hypothetical protein